MKLPRNPPTTPFTYFLTLCLLNFICGIVTLAIASNCSEEDIEYSRFWDHYYDPEEAYSFGKKIQSIVRNENLKDLFSLVDGELDHGPRRSFVEGKEFEQIFGQLWIDRVLNDTPSCQPVGWRGFILGNGMVWYNKFENNWHIFSINGALRETAAGNLPIGWRINEKLLSFECFTKEYWPTGDNFKEFFEKFQLKDYGDFSANPGKYFGAEIPDLNPIKPSWCSNNFCKKNGYPETISLVKSLSKCQKNYDDLEIRNRRIWKEKGNLSYQYEIIGIIDKSKCQELAPFLEGICKQSYLISIGENGGGSIGWIINYNIYGLFETKSGGNYIVPLKNFRNKNNALNFLDGLK